MRQIIYTSTSTAGPGKADLDGILEQSRHNNAIDGVTGLLWSDGTRFMQVIEGPAVSVEATFARVEADPRHKGIVVQRSIRIGEREFGDWTMVQRSAGQHGDVYDTKMGRILQNTSPDIGRMFLDLLVPA